MEPQVDITKAEALRFSVKNEPWVEYKLEDGTALFGRLIVTKIFRTDQYDAAGQPVYGWTSQNLFTSITPKGKRGPPSPTQTQPVDPKTLNTTPVDFDRVGSEQWNVYHVSDGSEIRIKLEVAGIMRTDKFGPDGDPFYIINSQTIQRIKVNPSLIKKQTPKIVVPGQKAIYK